jgi:hypothetical protein
MEQNSNLGSFTLVTANGMAFALQRTHGLPHQVHSPQRVVKARMQSTRIHVLRQTQLLDSPEPLKVRMLNQIEQQLRWNCDESVNGIVENLLFVRCWHETKVTRRSCSQVAFANETEF